MQTIVSAKHKLIGVPANPAVVNLFPNGKPHRFMDSDWLLVPHAETEVYLLRKLGFEAPAPILTQYAFPQTVDKPAFEVQKKTAALLTMARRAYVLNGMGTGKTKFAIWSFLYLKAQKRATKMLVIAEGSVWKTTVRLAPIGLLVRLMMRPSRATLLNQSPSCETTWAAHILRRSAFPRSSIT